MMFLIIVFVLFLILAVWGFMQKAVFGKDSVGARLERVLNSPNYKNGAFQNINITVYIWYSFIRVGMLFIF